MVVQCCGVALFVKFCVGYVINAAIFTQISVLGHPEHPPPFLVTMLKVRSMSIPSLGYN